MKTTLKEIRKIIKEEIEGILKENNNSWIEQIISIIPIRNGRLNTNIFNKNERQIKSAIKKILKQHWDLNKIKNKKTEEIKQDRKNWLENYYDNYSEDIELHYKPVVDLIDKKYPKIYNDIVDIFDEIFYSLIKRI